jgi:hypothetical protein
MHDRPQPIKPHREVRKIKFIPKKKPTTTDTTTEIHKSEKHKHNIAIETLSSEMPPELDSDSENIAILDHTLPSDHPSKLAETILKKKPCSLSTIKQSQMELLKSSNKTAEPSMVAKRHDIHSPNSETKGDNSNTQIVSLSNTLNSNEVPVALKNSKKWENVNNGVSLSLERNEVDYKGNDHNEGGISKKEVNKGDTGNLSSVLEVNHDKGIINEQLNLSTITSLKIEPDDKAVINGQIDLPTETSLKIEAGDKATRAKTFPKILVKGNLSDISSTKLQNQSISSPTLDTKVLIQWTASANNVSFLY